VPARRRCGWRAARATPPQRARAGGRAAPLQTGTARPPPSKAPCISTSHWGRFCRRARGASQRPAARLCAAPERARCALRAAAPACPPRRPTGCRAARSGTRARWCIGRLRRARVRKTKRGSPACSSRARDEASGCTCRQRVLDRRLPRAVAPAHPGNVSAARRSCARGAASAAAGAALPCSVVRPVRAARPVRVRRHLAGVERAAHSSAALRACAYPLGLAGRASQARPTVLPERTAGPTAGCGAHSLHR